MFSIFGVWPVFYSYAFLAVEMSYLISIVTPSSSLVEGCFFPDFLGVLKSLSRWGSSASSFGSLLSCTSESASASDLKPSMPAEDFWKSESSSNTLSMWGVLKFGDCPPNMLSTCLFSSSLGSPPYLINSMCSLIWSLSFFIIMRVHYNSLLNSISSPPSILYPLTLACSSSIYNLSNSFCSEAVRPSPALCSILSLLLRIALKSVGGSGESSVKSWIGIIGE